MFFEASWECLNTSTGKSKYHVVKHNILPQVTTTPIYIYHNRITKALTNQSMNFYEVSV